MYEEYSEDGYSYADADGDMSDYSYARGRGAGAARDSRGRYSSEGGYSYARGGRGGRYSRRGYSYDGGKDEKVQILRDMMQEVSSDDERRALKQIIRRMEQE